MSQFEIVTVQLYSVCGPDIEYLFSFWTAIGGVEINCYFSAIYREKVSEYATLNSQSAELKVESGYPGNTTQWVSEKRNTVVVATYLEFIFRPPRHRHGSNALQQGILPHHALFHLSRLTMVAGRKEYIQLNKFLSFFIH